jgi:hypothetical protein
MLHIKEISKLISREFQEKKGFIKAWDASLDAATIADLFQALDSEIGRLQVS